MIVAIHQPQYMPWLGYFYKMDRADAFIHLDTVQFRKSEFQNRNRIKSENGWHWLTVPVVYNSYKSLIKDIEIDDGIKWQSKHRKSIEKYYSKSEYYNDIMSAIRWAFSEKWDRLSILNIEVINRIKELLGIVTDEYQASDLEVKTRQPDKRIIELIKAVGGDAYLSGPGGKNYMDLDAYKDAGIKVIFESFNHPEYKQQYGEFQPHMSILDLLFNHGGSSLGIIRGEK